MSQQAPVLPFPEYRPDVVDYEGISSQIITNVVRRGDGYGPFPDLAALTASLPAPCRGAFSAQLPNGQVQIFAGTATKLYVLDNTSFTWTDASRGAGTYTSLAPTGQWQFVQFGSLILATQQNDLLQVFTLGVSAAFTNNPGSPPQAAYIAVVGQFVVLLGLLSLPFREQWSGLGDTTNWTAGINQSDFQDFTDGGITKGAAGGEYGVIFQDHAIRQMTYAPGSSYIFQFTRICEDQGLLAPYALARAASKIVFLSAQGWQLLIPGTLPIPIGKEKIDRTFSADWDNTNPQLLIGVNDPNSTRVLFGYKSVNGIAGMMDTLITYDYVLEGWTPVHGINNGNGIEYLFTATKPGLTLDGLDLAATQLIVITGAVAGSGNLVLQSNTFSNAVWTAVTSTVTPNSGTSPDGTNDAWKWLRSSTASSFLQQVMAKAASALTYTFSIYAKLFSGAAPAYLALYVDDSTGGSTGQVTFNLATGVISNGPVSGGFTNLSVAMTFSPVGQFWRCTFTFTTNAGANLRVAFAGNSNNSLLTGTDSVSNTAILVFGAQVEQLSHVAAYLPTTAAAVTRVKLTVSTINLPALVPPVDSAPSPTQLQDNALIDVYNVGGTTEANGEGHPINVIDSTHIELQDVPFVHAYTSGGNVAGPEDAMTLSFDNYVGLAEPALAAFDSANKMGFFNGPNLAAALESSEHGGLGTRIFMSGYRPITDASAIVGTASRRERLQDSRTYGTLQPLTAQGLIPVRVSTRYTRARVVIPAGATWTYVTGVEPQVRPNGRR